MTKVFKLDSTFVSINKAKNILDFLTDTQAKIAYLKDLLNKSGGYVDHINSSNVDAIFNRLRSHIENVQNEGGTHLSIEKTLKSITFIHKHDLKSGEYMAFSVNFGVTLEKSTGLPVKWHTISEGFEPSSVRFLGALTEIDGVNYVTRSAEDDFNVISTEKINFKNFGGFINGYSGRSPQVSTPLPSFVKITTSVHSDYGIIAKPFGESVLIDPNYMSSVDGSIKLTRLGSVPPEVFNDSGLAVCYTFNTTSISGFINGIVISDVSNSATIPPTDTIAPILLEDVSFRAITSREGGYMTETWCILRSDDELARALSLHLDNRQ